MVYKYRYSHDHINSTESTLSLFVFIVQTTYYLMDKLVSKTFFIIKITFYSSWRHDSEENSIFRPILAHIEFKKVFRFL